MNPAANDDSAPAPVLLVALQLSDKVKQGDITLKD
jgi:hypothetical protein